MSYARTAVTRMTLDMSRPDLQRSETVSLGDVNRRWEITLINGGAPFRVPSNWVAWIAGVKPDGNPLMLGCSIVDGKIIFDFASGKQIATCVGSFAIQIDIADEMGEIVATPKIYVNVLGTARPLDDLESDGQYEVIGEALTRLTAAETAISDNDKDIAKNKTDIATQGARVGILESMVSEYGSIKIETTAWETTKIEGYNYVAWVKVNGFKRGTILTLLPSTELTRKAAVEARLVSSADGFKFVEDEHVVELLVKSKPTIALDMTYILNKSPMDSFPAVALLGIDASPDEEVAAIQEAMSEYGRIKIETEDWEDIKYDGYSYVAWLEVNGFKSGTILTLLPSTEQTRKDAAAAGLVTSGDGFKIVEDKFWAEILVKSKPTNALDMTYILNKSALDRMPAVAVLGMDMPNTESAQELVDEHNKDKEAHPHLLQLIEAVEKALSGITDTKIHVLDELPALADAVVYNFYLILGEDKEQGDLYDEYICLQDKDKVKYWEYIGTRKIDLSNYMTSAETSAEIARQIGLIQFPQIPSKLPNPQSITIFGKSYDGSTAVTVTKQEIVQAVVDALDSWEEVAV